VKGVAQGVSQGAAEDVPQGVAQEDLAFGARAAHALLASPPQPPPPSLRSSRLADMGAQLGSSVAVGSGCGKALPGVPRKAPRSLLHPRKRRTRALVLTGGPGAAPGGVASKNRQRHMRVQRNKEAVSYSPRPLWPLNRQLGVRLFLPNILTGAWRCLSCPSLSSSGRTHDAQHTRAAPHAALGRHVKDEHPTFNLA